QTARALRSAGLPTGDSDPPDPAVGLHEPAVSAKPSRRAGQPAAHRRRHARAGRPTLHLGPRRRRTGSRGGPSVNQWLRRRRRRETTLDVKPTNGASSDPVRSPKHSLNEAAHKLGYWPVQPEPRVKQTGPSAALQAASDEGRDVVAHAGKA